MHRRPSPPDDAKSLDEIIAAYSDGSADDGDRRLFTAPPIDPPAGCTGDDRPINDLF